MSSKILDKYVEMVSYRNDYETINPDNFILPSLDEMVAEDLMSEILENGLTDEESINANQKILDKKFYTESPFTLKPGHYPDKGAFVLSINTLEYNIPENDLSLSKVDGDTFNFDCKWINDGGTPVILNEVGHGALSYSSFKDYWRKIGGTDELSLRILGIDTAEIPKYEMIPISKLSEEERIEEMKYKDMIEIKKSNKKVYHKNFNTTMNSDGSFSVTARDDDEIVRMLKVEKFGEILYTEIIEKTDDGSTINNIMLNEFLEENGYIQFNTDIYNYHLVMASEDESQFNLLSDGLHAQRIAARELRDADEIILVLSSEGLTTDKEWIPSIITFNSFYYVSEIAKFLKEEWDKHYKHLAQTNYNYTAFGADTYGRALGVIYIKKNNQWINLNKYLLCETQHSIANTEYYTPELQATGSGVDSSFNMWSYDRDNILWLDNYNNIADKNYDQRFKIHEEILGINFNDVRECSLMIGDTFFLVPPESIRDVSQSLYEKVPNIRNKGTSAKHKENTEHILELNLYFYEEAGINGIPNEVKLPNGEKITYYMNGLRSLIAQFKIAPYLPIENGYINDILGIEAVTLRNLNIETVDGVPRLLKAVLILREFNYRIFMPDMPVHDDIESNNSNENRSFLSKQPPMFAKSFNWEVFRYYYQRSLIAGHNLSTTEKANGILSYKYSEEFYANKNAIGYWDFCSGEGAHGKIDLFIPDENWLNAALQIKNEKDKNQLSVSSNIEETEESNEFLNKIAMFHNNIMIPFKYDTTTNFYAICKELITDIIEEKYNINLSYFMYNDLINNTEKTNYNENIDSLTTSILILDGDVNFLRDNYLMRMRDEMMKLIDASIFSSVSINEIIQVDLNKIVTVKWEFAFQINTDTLSDDITKAKLILEKYSESKVLEDNIYKVHFEMSFSETGSDSPEYDLRPEIPGIEYDPSYKLINNYDKNSGYEITDDIIQDAFDSRDSIDENVLKTYWERRTEEQDIDGDTTTTDSLNDYNETIDFHVKDYKNPANMPYLEYLTNIPCKMAAANITNSFTEVSIKAIEGVGPQYMGGQDTQIQLQIVTGDNLIVSALKMLPILASSMAKKYRKIIPAWPIKINTDITKMLGVSEILIDTIDISTVEGYPGVYSITMQITSVDRTQRQRESLRKLDVAPEGGKITPHSSADMTINSYFSINNALSDAELYPDLDLPTLSELGQAGFRFLKYDVANRRYPDPDFYVMYNYAYTSLSIKKMVKDTLSKYLLGEEEENKDLSYTFKDFTGSEVIGKIKTYTGMTFDSHGNSKSEKYSQILKELENRIKDTTTSKYSLKKHEEEQILNNIKTQATITNLWMADINEGWELKPSWEAPLPNKTVEVAIKEFENGKENEFASEIVKLRKEAINLIDKILSSPIVWLGSNFMKVEEFQESTAEYNIRQVIDNVFNENPYGKELINLLCFGHNSECRSPGYYKDKTDWNKGNPFDYLYGFLFASGCTLSGNIEFAEEEETYKWYPNHFSSSGKHINMSKDKNGNNVSIPYATISKTDGTHGVAINAEKTIGLTANSVGAYRIMRYDDAKTIIEKFQTENSYKYSSSAYKSSILPGYADPYYNNPEKEEEYREGIAKSMYYNAVAFTRLSLISLRKMITDGLIISEIDILARDWNKFKESFAYYDGDTTDVTNPDSIYNTAHSEAMKVLLLSSEESIDNANDLLNYIKESINKSFCTRLIYPFIIAATDCDRQLYEKLKERDYNSLNATRGYINDTSLFSNKVTKFLNALDGIGMTEASKEDLNSISSSQQMFNSLTKQIFIAASDNPKAYLLHSFYDMLVNDKRGRLVRAFPTYYVVFVDEGRKLGSWKLHDNFYNMNAISSINVVKSRKIAADTCSLTMNNVFNSYTMESNSATAQQYTDIYGLKDVFDSIFSPKVYFEKEKAIRMRQIVTDTVYLQAGIRIHVRSGYSSDASQLPIIFNGKIAEIEVGDVVQIVAQGDGHELMNPLNAFGEIEAVSLQEVQETITWFKDIRGSWSKGGMSPRDLLSYIVSAQHGGIKGIINNLSDGTWFNTNPFGIMHFGDSKFTSIFEQGETVQNLYEVSDKTRLSGTSEFTKDIEDEEHMTPIINTNIEDKTAWDLLHLAANSGVGYIGSITDFGFRSSMFLGKPNHYYAYGYDLIDNKIVEKRKPFQQFHYYNSYTDIIYNSIRASEATMKTNAVGMWTSTHPLFGTSQSTVGPIYLDMNIYPEYQKSMTVDTTLVASGNGGIDFNLFTYLSERHATSEFDDKVNKHLAWRVTANALKNSVKDMYQGDVAVLGDPTVKPYDRIYIHDSYEDMSGMFEVEAVVHNLNGETGFTTSIMPDVIARHEDNLESATNSLLSITGGMITTSMATLVGRKVLAASVYGKLATSIAKSNKTLNVANTVSGIARTIYSQTGFEEFLKTRPAAEKFFSSLNFTTDVNYSNLSAVENALKYFEKLDDLSSLDDINEVIKAFGHYSNLDTKKLDEVLNNMVDRAKYGEVGYKKSDIDKFIKEIDTWKNKAQNTVFRADLFNEKELVEQILSLEVEDIKVAEVLPQNIKDIIGKWNTDTPDVDVSDVYKVLTNADISDAISKGTIKTTSLDDYILGFKNLFEDSATKKAPMTMIIESFRKGDMLKDSIVIAKGFMKTNIFTILFQLAMDCTVSIMIKNAQETFTRFLQSIQAIDVYPLMKHGRPLTAGMIGNKGAVQGFPTYEGYDSIQGMILNFYEGIRKFDGDWPFMDLLTDLFVDPNVLGDLAKDWRTKLGLEAEEDVDEESKFDERFMQEIYGDISSSYAANSQQGYAIMTAPRITKSELENPAYYKDKYQITSTTITSIIRDERLLELNYILANIDIRNAVRDGRFVLCHSDENDTVISVQFESGAVNIPIMIINNNNNQSSIIDIPVVRDELIYILTALTSSEKLKDEKIYFKSGLRLNVKGNTWENTGFWMKIECKDGDKLESALKELQGASDIINNEGGLFEYIRKDKVFDIIAYPPVDLTYLYDNNSNS